MVGEYLYSYQYSSLFQAQRLGEYLSDALLDEYLDQDKYTKADISTLAGHDLVAVAGEITSSANVNIPLTVMCTMKDDLKCAVPREITSNITEQSADISIGVLEGQGLFLKEQGSGATAIISAMACNETAEMLPAGFVHARNIINRLNYLRENNIINFLRPDSSALVTMRYVDGKPVDVYSVIVCAQHEPDIWYHDVRDGVIKEVIDKAIPTLLMKKSKYFVNTSGRFTVGSLDSDTGLSNRNIMSGKDASKPEKFGTYMARYICKNIVASGLADNRCKLQIVYSIGMENPISISLNCYGTAHYSENIIIKAIKKVFDLTPKGIIKNLNLNRAIYKETARHGCFGIPADDEERCKIYTWERTDKSAELLDVVKTISKGRK